MMVRVGTIVGAAMGGVVAIAVIVAVATFMLNSRRQGPGESPGRGATQPPLQGKRPFKSIVICTTYACGEAARLRTRPRRRREADGG